MVTKSDLIYRRIRRHARQRIEFPEDTPPNERLKGYKEFLKVEREMILRYHRRGESGRTVCQGGAILVDVLVGHLFKTAVQACEKKRGEPLPCECSLVALGGYGRGEMSPMSDIDVMFLYPDGINPRVLAEVKQSLTDAVLYPLWDLGFKVGHSSRTVREAIQESRMDIKSRNSLLECRVIAGSMDLFAAFREAYREALSKSDLPSYLAELIDIQQKRRLQHGGNVFASEPNIKNGVGGLRDYQGIFWANLMLYGTPSLSTLYQNEILYEKEINEFDQAYDYLLRLRNELHLTQQRASDELILSLQPVVAQNLGYEGSAIQAVESLMKDYYFHARRIFRIAETLETRFRKISGFARETKRRGLMARMGRSKPERVDGFVIQDDEIRAEHEGIFVQDPMRMIRVFALIQEKRVGMSFELERLIEASLPMLTSEIIESPVFKDGFKALMRHSGRVYPVIQGMYDLGILVKVLPEFRNLHCLIQHDLHLVRYAEDIRVLNAIRKLDQVFTSGDGVERTLREEAPMVDLKDWMYWMFLLYPIEFPGSLPGHARLKDLPVAKADAILARFAFSREERERILTIIGRHRKVARFWQQEVEDSRIITIFAETIHDFDSLYYSFVFFYCDAWGRNPQYWDIHSFARLHGLFDRVARRFGDGAGNGWANDIAERIHAMKETVIARVVPEIPEEEIEAHFHLLPERYFATREVDEVNLHILLVHRLLHRIHEADSLGSLKPVIDWRWDPANEAYVVTIVTWDRAGLFYKLAAAFSAAGLNILKARAMSREDHIAIDTFNVTHPKLGMEVSDEDRARFEVAIQAVLVDGEGIDNRIREEFDKSHKKGILDRGPAFEISMPVRVEVYADPELEQVVLEYQGRDHIGLLYQVTKSVSNLSFNIESVRISTRNFIASGTLLLEDMASGEADPLEARMDRLRDRLVTLLGSSSWIIP